jgi:intermediate peptidase
VSLSNANSSAASESLFLLRRLKAQHLGLPQSSASSVVINPWDRDFYSFLLPLTSAPPPLLSIGACLQALSRLFQTLFGIRFELEETGPGEVWDPHVRKLSVRDDAGDRLGTVYCDLHSRAGKPGGAAHFTVTCSRRVDDDEADQGEMVANGAEALGEEGEVVQAKQGLWQKPVVVLTCNFEGEDERGKLHWAEVETLFHEVGHAIHCKFPFSICTSRFLLTIFFCRTQ